MTRAVLIGLPALALCLASTVQVKAGTKKVNCDKRSLQVAVDRAHRNDTIYVSGTCNERVTVQTDNITIDGKGVAVIDGTFDAGGDQPLVAIEGRGVTFRNITVQDSPYSGIVIRRGGWAIISGTTVQNNARDGIAVNQNTFVLIGAGPGEHPAAGTAPGNSILNNGRYGISVTGNSHAQIFHNLITGNVRGISITNGSAASADGNTISGNSGRGISLSVNGVITLSTSVDHHDTGLGDARPVVDPENNLIQQNLIGLRCRLGGGATGNPQNFGTGNPGTGGTPHASDADTNDCHISSTLNFP